MRNTPPPGQSIKYYLSLVVSIAYILMGGAFFFLKNHSSFSNYDNSLKIGFSALLCAYGAFRLYRVMNPEVFEEE